MRVSGGCCLMVTWNMVPFSKGEANSRAHGLNHACITELMTLYFWKKKKKREEKVGRGSMLVRSDRRSSFDLPKNNNRGVMGIKGLCKRHNDHRPSEPSSLTLTPFLIACTFESPHFPWINTMISKMLVSGNWTQVKCSANSRRCRWSSGWMDGRAKHQEPIPWSIAQFCQSWWTTISNINPCWW